MDETCPVCGSEVHEAEWVKALPDADGNPAESSGYATYCTEVSCRHHLNPIN